MTFNASFLVSGLSGDERTNCLTSLGLTYEYSLKAHPIPFRIKNSFSFANRRQSEKRSSLSV